MKAHRVRLVLDIECNKWSLVALRLVLREVRWAAVLRLALAEALEAVVARRTDSEPGVWRFTVTGGRLESLEPEESALPERSGGGPGEEGGTQ